MFVCLVLVAGCGSSGEGSARPTTSDDGGVPTPAPASDAAIPPVDGGTVEASGSDSEAGLPNIPLGAPIQAPDGVWTDVAFPEGYCRDGESAHLMVHLNSHSKKVAIYLEGGGACFNDASCEFLTFDAPSYAAGQGIFDFSNPRNPIGDWNVFYVPYCSGDVHAGNNPMGDPGSVIGTQKYTGYTNLQLYLSRILATVPAATDELLTGSSAGGFGAGLTASLVARNVPASVQRFTLLDDSGQPMSSQYIPTCLQDTWRKVWGFDETFLKECGAGCPKSDDYVFDWIQYLLNTYAKGALAPKFMGGLVSWTSDQVISTFYGFGANDCTVTSPAPMSGAAFEAGLLGFRSFVQGQTSAFGTFYAAGSSHTFLIQNSAGYVQGAGLLGGLYDTEAGGVKLVDWIDDLLAHKQAAHVGP